MSELVFKKDNGFENQNITLTGGIVCFELTSVNKPHEACVIASTFDNKHLVFIDFDKIKTMRTIDEKEKTHVRRHFEKIKRKSFIKQVRARFPKEIADEMIARYDRGELARIEDLKVAPENYRPSVKLDYIHIKQGDIVSVNDYPDETFVYLTLTYDLPVKCKVSNEKHGTITVEYDKIKKVK